MISTAGKYKSKVTGLSGNPNASPDDDNHMGNRSDLASSDSFLGQSWVDSARISSVRDPACGDGAEVPTDFLQPAYHGEDLKTEPDCQIIKVTRRHFVACISALDPAPVYDACLVSAGDSIDAPCSCDIIALYQDACIGEGVSVARAAEASRPRAPQDFPPVPS